MPLLDDRGRLFGKLNLIDAAVAAVVLLLIPLGYAAYLLFQPPVPTVTAVTPKEIKVAAAKGAYLDVQGTNLRPYFRAFMNKNSAEYLFATPDHAQVRLAEMPPGDYELILFDEAQEVARGQHITILPPEKVVVPDDPLATVVVVGSFNRIEDKDVAEIRKGAKLLAVLDSTVPVNEWLEVMAVQPPRPATIALAENNPVAVQVAGRKQVVAAVRLQGRLPGKELMFKDKRVVVGAELEVPIAVAPEPPPAGAPPAPPPAPDAPRKTRPLTFVVQKVYPDNPAPIDIRIRSVVRPEVLALAQRDLAAPPRDLFGTLTPRIQSLRVERELVGETKNDLREGRINVIEAVFRLPATRTADGWSFENRPVRPGIDIQIETATYQLIGNVLTLEPRSESGRD